jgi:hypothetical protein
MSYAKTVTTALATTAAVTGFIAALPVLGPVGGVSALGYAIATAIGVGAAAADKANS